MRIPPSVVVMSLLTATPFALGIRATLKEKAPADELMSLDPDEQSARRDKAALEAYEAEQRAEAEAEAAKKKARIAELDGIIGKTAASFGPAFGNVALGAKGAWDPETEPLLQQASRDGVFEVASQRDLDNQLDVVQVRVQSGDFDESACDAYREKLTAAWGAPNNNAWLDKATNLRAFLSEDGCTLTYAKVLTPAAWVAALPIAEVGKAAPAGYTDGDTSTKDIGGIGFGSFSTSITMYVDGTKTTTVTAEADTDFDTLVAIRDALSAQLKAQPERDEYETAWTWKKKPGFRLEQEPGGNHFTLTIGKNREQ